MTDTEAGETSESQLTIERAVPAKYVLDPRLLTKELERLFGEGKFAVEVSQLQSFNSTSTFLTLQMPIDAAQLLPNQNVERIQAGELLNFTMQYLTRFADSSGRPGPVMSKPTEDTFECFWTLKLHAGDRCSLKV